MKSRVSLSKYVDLDHTVCLEKKSDFIEEKFKR
jgi:hypothetical protein